MATTNLVWKNRSHQVGHDRVSCLGLDMIILAMKNDVEGNDVCTIGMYG